MNNTLIYNNCTTIGLNTAIHLARYGMTVTVLGSAKASMKLASKIFLAKGVNNVSFKFVDFNQSDQVNQLLNEIEDKRTPLYKNFINFVSNPTYSHCQEKDFEDSTENLESDDPYLLLSQAMICDMVANGGGNIVNVRSFHPKGNTATTSRSADLSARACLNSLTHHLALELSEFQIRINTICLNIDSFLRTEIAIERYRNLDFLYTSENNPCSAETCEVIEFLLSNQAEWITGLVWDVNEPKSPNKRILLEGSQVPACNSLQQTKRSLFSS